MVVAAAPALLALFAGSALAAPVRSMASDIQFVDPNPAVFAGVLAPGLAISTETSSAALPANTHIDDSSSVIRHSKRMVIPFMPPSYQHYNTGVGTESTDDDDDDDDLFKPVSSSSTTATSTSSSSTTTSSATPKPTPPSRLSLLQTDTDGTQLPPLPSLPKMFMRPRIGVVMRPSSSSQSASVTSTSTSATVTATATLTIDDDDWPTLSTPTPTPTPTSIAKKLSGAFGLVAMLEKWTPTTSSSSSASPLFTKPASTSTSSTAKPTSTNGDDDDDDIFDALFAAAAPVPKLTGPKPLSWFASSDEIAAAGNGRMIRRPVPSTSTTASAAVPVFTGDDLD